MSSLFSELKFKRGPSLKNRFMLAPLTNSQSHADGVLSDEEFHWLTMRAKGGFGLTMTCAAHVQAIGQGFPGQLGIFDNKHIEGLERLADAIKQEGSVSICQLHHAGMRSPEDLIKQTPVCPSINKELGARALSEDEVKEIIEDFIMAAIRAESAGFDGVELHGAHGYLLCQFFSNETNQRKDEYGGSLTNRSRILFEILDGIRERCNPNFMVGVRLSPERFGMKLEDSVLIAQRLCDEGNIDFLDMSLWDVFKEPMEEDKQGTSLLSYFTKIDRGDVRLGIAGQIRTPEEAQKALASGVDWIMLGRAAILHHDFPLLMQKEPKFQPMTNPVSREHLAKEGLSEKFIEYMASWKGFVAE
ncbi:NADH:flavin oxidoreductase [Gammaproteobacteria bacterium]|nr:NADH:flavin oxidoreductase [Gammaproteobacteria bacterium]